MLIKFILAVLILLVLTACASQTTPTAIPTPTPAPTPTAASPPIRTPLEVFWYTLDHFEVPDPNNQQIAEACMGHEYFGWLEQSEYIERTRNAAMEDKLAMGYILSDTSPRYAMDVGIVGGALAAFPVEERKNFCRKYR